MVGLLPDNLDFKQPKCTAHESTVAGTRAIVLDNGVFTLSILPEFGGRLCSLFFRPANLELLATDFLIGPRKSLNVRGGWLAACPSLLADGELLTHLPWQAEIAECSDARVTVRLWGTVERVTHVLDGQVRVTPTTILIERFVRLTAGESAVVVEDVLMNRGSWPVPITWSGVVSLRASSGDRAVLPVGAVEVQRGVGPSGNELDFGLLVSTPYQALARDLREGWLGLRLAHSPIDLRITFPKKWLPHAAIAAVRDDERPAENAFRFQPLATPGPMAEDTHGNALVLPPGRPVSLPIRLEAGAGILTTGEWSRPGLQLAELIAAQQVPQGRLALWRVGEIAMALKTPRHLVLLLPEFKGDVLLLPDDLPMADLILFADAPPKSVLRRLVKRTSARFIGPSALRQSLLEDGVGEERSIALSPGARFDLPGLGVLAIPARGPRAEERLGYLLQIDHLSLYHAGYTNFLGEFGSIGRQFHPLLLLLPLRGMTMADTLHASKQLNPRLVVPLGTEENEHEFIRRCRTQHVSFASQALYHAEGVLFDGWTLNPLS